MVDVDEVIPRAAVADKILVVVPRDLSSLQVHYIKRADDGVVHVCHRGRRFGILVHLFTGRNIVRMTSLQAGREGHVTGCLLYPW